LQYAEQKTFYIHRYTSQIHGIFTLARIRQQYTTRIAIRFITNESHPIRSYFMNNKIHDEYATKPRTIKSIFIRAIEYLGKLQIDVRRIETTPYYLRPPQRKTRYEQIDSFLCAIPKGSRAGEWRMIIRDTLNTLMAVEGDINSLTNYWTKKERKSPFSGCQAIWE
jgi:hypothetical protein